MRPGRPPRRDAADLDPAPLRLLTSVLQQVLALDVEAQRILAGVEGRRLRLVIDGPAPGSVDLVVQAGQARLCDPAQEEADVALCGTIPALLGLLRSGGNVLPGGNGVAVTGDIGVLRSFQQALHELQPDWEEPMARLLGDRLAQPLSRGLRGLARLAAESVGELKDATSEYLREESDLLVRKEDLAAFGEGVEVARDRVERLQKRLESLQRRLPAGSPEA